MLVAAILHAAASCVLGPAIAAISLGLVGHAAIGERFGRNARFASIGAALPPRSWATFGYLLHAPGGFLRHRSAARPDPARAVAHRAAEIDPERAHGDLPRLVATGEPPVDLRSLLASAPC